MYSLANSKDREAKQQHCFSFRLPQPWTSNRRCGGGAGGRGCGLAGRAGGRAFGYKPLFFFVFFKKKKKKKNIIVGDVVADI